MRLLPSQRAFIFAPERFSVLTGGMGCGKTRAAIIKGLILSHIFPGNHGMVGRFHASDLEDSVLPLFWEVCPPTWVRKWDKQRKIVTFKNYSDISFRHMDDASATKKS